MWVFAVSAEIAAWRLQEEGHHPAEHFDPLWKLLYMWDHPYHFPLAAWRALSGWGDRLWQELIGIVGWQDILLPTWTYVALTVLLFLVPFQKLQVSGATRARVAVITGLVVLSYVILVYLIFFLTYTPLDVDHVRGVQGRYFVVVIPVAAIFRRYCGQPRIAKRRACGDCDYRLNDRRNCDCRSTLPGTLVMRASNQPLFARSNLALTASRRLPANTLAIAPIPSAFVSGT